MRIALLIGAVMFYFCFLNAWVQAYDFPKAAKHVPRIGRSKPPIDPRNDAFEKFFLKASKSVPRIGRREPPMVYYNDDVEKYLDTSYKRPIWADISEKFEYDPEIFGNPQLLEEYETALADDPLAYDIPSRMRYKRESIPSRKDTNTKSY
ncbi:hypothetical protein AMK59_1212 [Oryctes borbonicus]|uniref:Uncharacterized protein n=1 Tax=Oryctes borbonicus TaxID=1629725 RepID=A0A0T6BHV2_9SCAR|nr:hypothetical protein AMK59_1212 [Oryctes borbonicus]